MKSNKHIEPPYGFCDERKLFEQWGQSLEYFVYDKIVYLYEAPLQVPSTHQVYSQFSIDRKVMKKPYVLVLLEDKSVSGCLWHIYAAILIDFKVVEDSLSSTSMTDQHLRLQRKRLDMLVRDAHLVEDGQRYSRVEMVSVPVDVRLKVFHCHDSFRRRPLDGPFNLPVFYRYSRRFGKLQFGDGEACALSNGSPAFLNQRTCNVVERDSEMEHQLAEQEASFHRKGAEPSHSGRSKRLWIDCHD